MSRRRLPLVVVLSCAPVFAMPASPAAAAGAALPWDFAGDGFPDVAIGVPYEDLAGERDVPGEPEAGDRFGSL